MIMNYLNIWLKTISHVLILNVDIHIRIRIPAGQRSAEKFDIVCGAMMKLYMEYNKIRNFEIIF